MPEAQVLERIDRRHFLGGPRAHDDGSAGGSPTGHIRLDTTAATATPAIDEDAEARTIPLPYWVDEIDHPRPAPKPRPVVTVGNQTISWKKRVKPAFRVMRADTLRELPLLGIDPETAILPTDDEHIAKVVQACVDKLGLKQAGQTIWVNHQSIPGRRADQTDGLTFAIHQDAVEVLRLNGVNTSQFHKIKNCVETQEIKDASAVIGFLGGRPC